jgi:hypothetical protein
MLVACPGVKWDKLAVPAKAGDLLSIKTHSNPEANDL